MRVGELFDASAWGYDEARRRLVPCFDAFYRAALDAVTLPKDASIRVLDLGAGTGLLSAFLAERFPKASFVLVDIAGAMLDRARERFGDDGGRFSYRTLDYGTVYPEGEYDAVVSALSIHHLTDENKRRLFQRIFKSLKPGGVFVNAEHLLGETPEMEREWDLEWERKARSLGSDDAEIAGARERMTEDQCAPLSKQLAWMEEAGFEDIGKRFQSGRFAVFSGRKKK